MKLLTLAAISSLAFTGWCAAPVQADHNDEMSPRFRLAVGVLICDEIGEVIERIETKNEILPAGCGSTGLPLFVEITMLPVYEAHDLQFQLVQFNFPMDRDSDGEIDDWWVQFGFWGAPVPVVIPSSLDIDA